MNKLPGLLPHSGEPAPQFRLWRLPCNQIIVITPKDRAACACRSVDWFFEASFEKKRGRLPLESGG